MRNTSKYLLIGLLLIAFGVVIRLFISNIVSNLVLQMILAGLFIVLAIVIVSALGMPKEKVYYKSYVVKNVIVFLISTILIAFLLGTFTGFDYNAFSFNWDFTIKYMICVVIYTIAREIVRYCIAKKEMNSKKPIIILTIAFIIFNLLFYNIDLGSTKDVFILLCTTLLPMIANETLASYLSFNFGLSTALIYMLPVSLYQYVLPILPNLGDFIISIILVLLPFLIYFSTIKVVHYKNKEKELKTSRLKYVLLIPITIFLVIVIILVSGLFEYKMIAIGSNSMNPVIYRGDAIIYRQMDNAKGLEVGDILVFEKNNIMVTHRIVSINYKNNKAIIKTKGDNNNTSDGFYVYEEEVLGVITGVVKYVGYPTIWFTETFKGV